MNAYGQLCRIVSCATDCFPGARRGVSSGGEVGADLDRCDADGGAADGGRDVDQDVDPPCGAAWPVARPARRRGRRRCRADWRTSVSTPAAASAAATSVSTTRAVGPGRPRGATSSSTVGRRTSGSARRRRGRGGRSGSAHNSHHFRFGRRLRFGFLPISAIMFVRPILGSCRGCPKSSRACIIRSNQVTRLPIPSLLSSQRRSSGKAQRAVVVP